MVNTAEQVLTISGEFPRPEQKWIIQARSTSTASIGEAMGGRNILSPSVMPIKHGLKAVGPATTCVAVPAQNLAIHAALEVARPGDVIVATADGGLPTTLWGMLVTTSAQARGVEGVVTDGFARDAGDIRRLDFPVWSAGITPRGARKDALGSVNHPVVCAGVLVCPGDLVVADDDGVVVIPIDEIESVVATALKREERERALAEKLRTGISTYEALRLGEEPREQVITFEL